MFFLLSIAILILDQVSKFLILTVSSHLPVKVFGGRIVINLVYNTGGAFGILKGQKIFFIVTAVFAAFIILKTMYDLRRKKPGESDMFGGTGRVTAFSLALILGGALGNLIDRLRFGYVIDFIDFGFWPVFNLADSSITIGITILIASVFLSGIMKKKGKTDASGTV